MSNRSINILAFVVTRLAAAGFCALVIFLCILVDRGKSKVGFIELPHDGYKLPSGLNPKWSHASYFYGVWPKEHIWGPFYKLNVSHSINLSSDSYHVFCGFDNDNGFGGITCKKFNFDIDTFHNNDRLIVKQDCQSTTSAGYSETSRLGIFSTSLESFIAAKEPDTSAGMKMHCFQFTQAATRLLSSYASNKRTDYVYGIYFEPECTLCCHDVFPYGTWHKQLDFAGVNDLYNKVAEAAATAGELTDCWIAPLAAGYDYFASEYEPYNDRFEPESPF